MSDEIQAADAVETEKEELKKALRKEAIEVGLHVDKRWSVERLTEEIGRKHTEAAQIKAVTRAQAEIKTASAVDQVTARVLPMGNLKISRGIHIPGKGDLKFATGDTITTDRTIAEALQAKGFVEIQGAA